eukprot:2149384-Prymnesium_polylepis.1
MNQFISGTGSTGAQHGAGSSTARSRASVCVESWQEPLQDVDGAQPASDGLSSSPCALDAGCR